MRASTAQMAVLVLTLVFVMTTVALAAPPPPPPPGAEASGPTPPRLSYVYEDVSFWRPGASDWAPAQLNTPLAPGDELYTSERGNVELQVGTRAFVRGAGSTQVGVLNQDSDFLQLKVTTGHLAIDLRTVDPGRTLEVDTPHAAFTLDQPGYYRVDVSAERTFFTTRRAGRATMSTGNGTPVAIAPSEEVVLEGTTAPTAQSYVAPEPDAWDQWNYARSDHLSETVSTRYVSHDVYGVDELDHYGSWRVVPEYGTVWIPEGVPAGWVPYSTGRWIMDPFYGWTWVDAAPWGWAPYHYGRWVFVNGFWGWAPGRLVVRPVYAPALVAFFSAPGFQVSVGPAVSWVALGWGEPVVPWWGRAGFVGRPWWGGWGGPRVVNNVVINRTTVVNANNITVYRNVGVPSAVVAVRRDQFGGRPVQDARIREVDPRRLEPVRGALGVKPEPASFVASPARAPRPPDPAVARPVVATRPPAHHGAANHDGTPTAAAVVNAPAPKIVPAPRPTPPTAVPARPPFGASQVERGRPSALPDVATQPTPVPSAPRTTVPQAAPHPGPGSVAPQPTPPHSGPPARVDTAPSAGPPAPHSVLSVPQQAATPPSRQTPPPAPQVAPQAVPRVAPQGVPQAMPPGGSPTPQGPGRTGPPAGVAGPRGPAGPPNQLPGEPANRLSPYRDRREGRGPQDVRGAQVGRVARDGGAPQVEPRRAGGHPRLPVAPEKPSDRSADRPHGR